MHLPRDAETWSCEVPFEHVAPRSGSLEGESVLGKMESVRLTDVPKNVIMFPPPAVAAVNYSFMRISFSFGIFSAEAKGQDSPETQHLIHSPW